MLQDHLLGRWEEGQQTPVSFVIFGVDIMNFVQTLNSSGTKARMMRCPTYRGSSRDAWLLFFYLRSLNFDKRPL